MKSRVGLSLLAALVGLVAAIPLASPSPAGAAPKALSLAMVPGGGELRIRGSEAPTPLGAPTTLDATEEDTTGAISAGRFLTPPARYEFDITTPIPARVYVDAAFSEITPGTVTGSVDDDDNVSIDMMVKADLDIEVGAPAILTAQCTAAPISLRLSSTAPYDRAGSRRVLLRDADFTVPAVATTPTCPDIISSGVNERLAGAGHSIQILMHGEIPEVLGAGENTATTLTVEPEVTRQGEQVALTANVIQEDGGPEVVAGAVEFRSGSNVVGSSALDGTGTATLLLADLPVGRHPLTARYVGDGTLYRASVSPVVDHLVAAAPTVDVAVGSAAGIGGGSMPATVTITNPAELGADIVNGRVDLVLSRSVGTADLSTDRVVVEWRNGTAWEPLTLSPGAAPRTVATSIGPVSGSVFASDSETPLRLRLRFTDVGSVPSPTACGIDNPTCPGPLTLAATFLEVDPMTGAVRAPRADASASFTLVEGARRASTITPAGGIRPHTVRQGYSIEAVGGVGPALAGLRPTGTTSFYVDGRLMPARRVVEPLGEYVESTPLSVTGAFQGIILLPPDIEAGRHVVTIRYSGDAVYAPSEATAVFTVLPSVGTPFICGVTNLNGSFEFGAEARFAADVPATAMGGVTLDIPLSQAEVAFSRMGTGNPLPQIPNNGTVAVGDPSLTGITFGVGPHGTGSATSVSRTGYSALAASPNPADESQVDQKLTLGSAAVSVTVDGEPGDVVPVTVDEVRIDFNFLNPPILYSATCRAVDSPVTLGEVEVAGTTLTVTPASPVREVTDDVTLAADTFPADAAGTVAFASDIDGDLGADAVAGGQASITTDELSPGTHRLTASFDASDPAIPDTTATPVAVVVVPAPGNAREAFVTAALLDFTGTAVEESVAEHSARLETGQGRSAFLSELARSDEWLTHVVSQLYLDTLGRPGDPAGVDFWVDRIRDGWSVARVAASFYSSNEYYGATGGTAEDWVDDLYRTLLGRASESNGRSYWVEQAALIGRGRVALQFFQTRESSRYRVAELYDHLLSRAPSSTDLDFWAPRVVSRGDIVLAVSLAASSEYYARASIRFPIV